MQNIKSEIRNKIICININTQIINKISLLLGHNFLDLTIPNNRELTIKNEFFRFNNLKTCIYQFHKIILKNYQITSKITKLNMGRLGHYIKLGNYNNRKGTRITIFSIISKKSVIRH